FLSLSGLRHIAPGVEDQHVNEHPPRKYYAPSAQKNNSADYYQDGGKLSYRQRITCRDNNICPPRGERQRDADLEHEQPTKDASSICERSLCPSINLSRL
ncbi:unnamed protein product, partial [Ectocarpus sp. 13 AM-2016]